MIDPEYKADVLGNSVIPADALADTSIVNNYDDVHISVTSSDGAVEKVYSLTFAVVINFETDTVFQPDNIVVSCSRDGMIYLVPENTDRELSVIQNESLLSVSCISNSKVSLQFSEIDDGTYWLYGVINSEQISEPVSFVLVTTDTVGINSSLPEKFCLYPNPSTSLINLETGIVDTYSIEIMSLSGQLIYSATMEGNTAQIDFSSFSRGVYFIMVKSKKYVWTEKVLKL